MCSHGSISYDSLDTDWQLVYEGDTRDWSHGNAVIVDPTDGGVIVSLRNQDAVVKIDRDSGELVWILGAHERWQPPWSDKLLTPAEPAADDRGAGFGWSFHQHAPMFTPRGGMLLFDNGNQRAIPPDPGLDPEERYSRLVEYRINETAGTVTQTWDEDGPDERWYSLAWVTPTTCPRQGTCWLSTGSALAQTGPVTPASSRSPKPRQPGSSSKSSSKTTVPNQR